ncbi:hypothetical protein [Maricaulis sp.]|uniref:hypothetical protein n=1 Tax=Maricaulis sp. TaxID=1486257 RepID=UPI002B268A49|nr:hypothetical protein [Maricaulis sp.]
MIPKATPQATVAIISALLTVFALGFSLLGLIDGLTSNQRNMVDSDRTTIEVLDRLIALHDAQQRDIEHLREIILAAEPDDLASARFLEAAQLTESLDARLNIIENTLGSDLERALSVPLLRSDLLALEASLAATASHANDRINQNFQATLQAWGFNAMLAVALIAAIVAQFFQRRQSSRES